VGGEAGSKLANGVRYGTGSADLTWLDGFTAHFLSLDIYELILHICGLLLFGFLCEMPWGRCRAYAPVLLYLCVGAPLTNYVGCGMLGAVSVLAGSYVAVNVALIHRKAEPSMIVKLSSVCYTIITQLLHCRSVFVSAKRLSLCYYRYMSRPWCTSSCGTSTRCVRLLVSPLLVLSFLFSNNPSAFFASNARSQIPPRLSASLSLLLPVSSLRSHAALLIRLPLAVTSEYEYTGVLGLGAVIGCCSVQCMHV
jgi:hypothetical protein